MAARVLNRYLILMLIDFFFVLRTYSQNVRSDDRLRHAAKVHEVHDGKFSE